MSGWSALPQEFNAGGPQPGLWSHAGDTALEFGERDEDNVDLWRVQLRDEGTRTRCAWTAVSSVAHASAQPEGTYRTDPNALRPEVGEWVERFVAMKRTPPGPSGVSCAFCGQASSHSSDLFIQGPFGSACCGCVDVMADELAKNERGLLFEAHAHLRRMRMAALALLALLGGVVLLAAVA